MAQEISKKTQSVELIQDVFGKYVDNNGKWHKVLRFTWTNSNKIRIQVINYGARIITIDLPDKKGRIADIVLGFNDFAGYYYYRNHYFGASIGRMANITENSTFSIDGKQYLITSNVNGNHHRNGGINETLDRVFWTPYIKNNQLILSYVSKDGSEGYPGDLLITITYELTARNEFKINYEAKSTAPTIINLTNLLYFNLAGHQMGCDEIYKHIVTLNCNCFTLNREDGLPNGKIMNVVNTINDFQIPKVLGKVIGIVPKDGFDQNFCVNRAVDQEQCFVVSILHPPSGRMMEIYSNQPGVQFTTCNEFGYGEILSLDEILKENHNKDFNENQSKMNIMILLMKKIHKNMLETFKQDIQNDFRELLSLIIKLQSETTNDLSIRNQNIVLTQLQEKYLKEILKVTSDDCDKTILDELQKIIKCILSNVSIKNEFGSIIKEPSQLKLNKDSIIQEHAKNNNETVFIPRHYTNSKKIIGKNGAVYKMHSGIAFQTQNYPNCANIAHFPNCILRPGETYKHTITYKFWIRSGNPNLWIKKNSNKSNYMSTSQQ